MNEQTLFKKKHILLRLWYRCVVIPAIFYLLLSLAAARTIAKPSLYTDSLAQNNAAEVIAGTLTTALESQGFPQGTIRFEPEWVEGNLNSLISGSFDYFSGRNEHLMLIIDTDAIYQQLPSQLTSANNVPGVFGQIIAAHGGPVDIAPSILGADGLAKLEELKGRVDVIRNVRLPAIALILLTLILTPLRVKKPSRPSFQEHIGRLLLMSGVAYVVMMWGAFEYFSVYTSPQLLSQMSQSWQSSIFQSLVLVFKSFVREISYLAIFLAAGGLLMMFDGRWTAQKSAEPMIGSSLATQKTRSPAGGRPSSR